MRYRPRFNSKRRELVWQREAHASFLIGRGPQPICNICGNPVFPHDTWDVSHDPARAKAFGGRDVGVAHHSCNLRHGAEIVTPAKAKADRVRRKHIGAAGAGLGKHPMRGGRRDHIRKTMRGGVVPRLTGAERHAQTLAALALTAADGVKVGLWAKPPANGASPASK